MALDQNAGKKRTVGIARNLLPAIESSTPNEPVTVASLIQPSPAQNYNQPLIASPAGATAQSMTARQAPQQNPSQVSPKSSVVEPQGAYAPKEIATQTGRNRKISFLTDRELEERFRKCRLKGGFDTLEDAYNEAIKRFCDQVDRGEIDNF